MSLADLQSALRDALVESGTTITGSLHGGRGLVATRLAIHRRHYHASLVAAIVARFPATGWLLGSAPVIAAAEVFVHAHPPSVPCIAEYGGAFPAFLADRTEPNRTPYVDRFATLDWQLGRVSVSADLPPMPIGGLEQIPHERLGDVTLTLQSGVHYLAADWPVDTVMTWYLRDSGPDLATLSPSPVRLELHGSRGEFRFTRLSVGVFVFRSGVAMGLPLGTAAERALIVDASFDPGHALAALFGDGLVTAAQPPSQE